MAKSEISIYRHIFAAMFTADMAASVVSENLVHFLPRALLDGPARELSSGITTRASLTISLAGFLLAALWVRPVHLWLNGKGEDIKAKAISRFNGIYRMLAALVVLGFVTAIAKGYFHGDKLPAGWNAREFWVYLVIPKLFEAYYGFYFMLSYLEPLLFQRIAARFYGEDEIFRRKKGLSLGIRARLLLMLLNLAVIPMLILILDISAITDFRAEQAYPLTLIIVALTYLIGNSEMLYRSVTKPIAELIKKMERLAKGEFNVKTSVLSDDELGALKAHFNDMVDGMAERERIKDTFGRYVSIEIARQLLSSGKIELGGDSIEATILFSDIRDFTPMSSQMPAKEVVEFLNSYFSQILVPISEHRGVVNKFIGDAVMAIFAPQFGSVNHVDDAVNAALGMRERLAEFNRTRPVPQEVRFGVGLHTGVLVAGNIGTESRLEFTVIGDTVNIASRIESTTKTLDSTILLSEDVHRNMSGSLKARLSLERCADVRLKGKEHPLNLYKIA